MKDRLMEFAMRGIAAQKAVDDVIANLTYRNYVHNRRRAPEISAESWRLVYGPATDEMELCFQAEEKRLEEQRLVDLDAKANLYAEPD